MSIIDRLRSLLGLGGGRGAGGQGAAAPGDATPGEGGEMISCEDALRLVHDFLDGELDGVSEARVKAHFDVCQRCYPHLHLESAFREALRRAAAGETTPPDLKRKVATLIAEAEAQD